LLNDPKN